MHKLTQAAAFLLLAAAAAAAPAAAQSDVQFLHCVPTSPGVLEYTCSHRRRRATRRPALPEQWTPIAGVQTLAADASSPRRDPRLGDPGHARGESAASSTRWSTRTSADSAGRSSRIQATGVVTGNVFTARGGSDGAVHLLLRTSSRATASSCCHGCALAAPCDAAGCDAADWQPIERQRRRSRLPSSPERGTEPRVCRSRPTGDEILISKDLGAQRWTITDARRRADRGLPARDSARCSATSSRSIRKRRRRSTASCAPTRSIAFAAYTIRLNTAQTMRERCRRWSRARPSRPSRPRAKRWIAAREPYQQTEVIPLPGRTDRRAARRRHDGRGRRRPRGPHQLVAARRGSDRLRRSRRRRRFGSREPGQRLRRKRQRHRRRAALPEPHARGARGSERARRRRAQRRDRVPRDRVPALGPGPERRRHVGNRRPRRDAGASAFHRLSPRRPRAARTATAAPRPVPGRRHRAAGPGPGARRRGLEPATAASTTRRSPAAARSRSRRSSRAWVASPSASSPASA